MPEVDRTTIFISRAPETTRPFYMNEPGYVRYFRENGKREMYRQNVPLPDPHGAQRKIDSLASKPWLWGVLPHNCASFVEEIIAAGGGNVGLYSNCPALEKWK